MTRVADVSALVFLRADFLGSYAVGARNLVNNSLNRYLGRNVVVENVRDNLLNGCERGLFIIKK